MCPLQNILNSGLMGSVVVGLITLLGVYLTLRGQRQLDKSRQEEIVEGVLQALYEELDILWERLNELVKDDWEKYEEEKIKGKKAIFSCNLPIRKDYFTVYNSNANLIGQVNKPPDLRRKIVKVYTLFGALIEGYRKNTELLQKREEIRIRWREAQTKGDTGEVTVNDMLYEECSSSLRVIAPKLKERHDEFGNLIEDLLKVLEEKFPHLKS